MILCEEYSHGNRRVWRLDRWFFKASLVPDTQLHVRIQRMIVLELADSQNHDKEMVGVTSDPTHSLFDHYVGRLAWSKELPFTNEVWLQIKCDPLPWFLEGML